MKPIDPAMPRRSCGPSERRRTGVGLTVFLQADQRLGNKVGLCHLGHREIQDDRGFGYRFATPFDLLLGRVASNWRARNSLD